MSILRHCVIKQHKTQTHILYVAVVYKEGPPFYHSSYSVIVRSVTSRFHDDNPNKLNWAALAGLNRVTETVNKVS